MYGEDQGVPQHYATTGANAREVIIQTPARLTMVPRVLHTSAYGNERSAQKEGIVSFLERVIVNIL